MGARFVSTNDGATSARSVVGARFVSTNDSDIAASACARSVVGAPFVSTNDGAASARGVVGARFVSTNDGATSETSVVNHEMYCWGTGAIASATSDGNTAHVVKWR